MFFFFCCLPSVPEVLIMSSCFRILMFCEQSFCQWNSLTSWLIYVLKLFKINRGINIKINPQTQELLFIADINSKISFQRLLIDVRFLPLLHSFTKKMEIHDDNAVSILCPFKFHCKCTLLNDKKIRKEFITQMKTKYNKIVGKKIITNFTLKIDIDQWITMHLSYNPSYREKYKLYNCIIDILQQYNIYQVAIELTQIHGTDYKQCINSSFTSTKCNVTYYKCIKCKTVRDLFVFPLCICRQCLQIYFCQTTTYYNHLDLFRDKIDPSNPFTIYSQLIYTSDIYSIDDDNNSDNDSYFEKIFGKYTVIDSDNINSFVAKSIFTFDQILSVLPLLNQQISTIYLSDKSLCEYLYIGDKKIENNKQIQQMVQQQIKEMADNFTSSQIIEIKKKYQRKNTKLNLKMPYIPLFVKKKNYINSTFNEYREKWKFNVDNNEQTFESILKLNTFSAISKAEEEIIVQNDQNYLYKHPYSKSTLDDASCFSRGIIYNGHKITYEESSLIHGDGAISFNLNIPSGLDHFDKKFIYTLIWVFIEIKVKYNSETFTIPENKYITNLLSGKYKTMKDVEELKQVFGKNMSISIVKQKSGEFIRAPLDVVCNESDLCISAHAVFGKWIYKQQKNINNNFNDDNNSQIEYNYATTNSTIDPIAYIIILKYYLKYIKYSIQDLFSWNMCINTIWIPPRIIQLFAKYDDKFGKYIDNFNKIYKETQLGTQLCKQWMIQCKDNATNYKQKWNGYTISFNKIGKKFKCQQIMGCSCGNAQCYNTQRGEYNYPINPAKHCALASSNAICEWMIVRNEQDNAEYYVYCPFCTLNCEMKLKFNENKRRTKRRLYDLSINCINDDNNNNARRKIVK